MRLLTTMWRFKLKTVTYIRYITVTLLESIKFIYVHVIIEIKKIIFYKMWKKNISSGLLFREKIKFILKISLRNYLVSKYFVNSNNLWQVKGVCLTSRSIYIHEIVVKAVVLAIERSLSELVSYTCLFVLPRPSSVFR